MKFKIFLMTINKKGSVEKSAKNYLVFFPFLINVENTSLFSICSQIENAFFQTKKCNSICSQIENAVFSDLHFFV
jgi:hypothetical protein